MICCVQRAKRASVTVDGAVSGEIGPGLLVLLGVEKGDEESYIGWIADKIVNLRIFEDENGKMSRSISDTGGSVLVVSQFTLAGDVSRGRRPDFGRAESPARAKIFYEKLIENLRNTVGEKRVASGVFGTRMEVFLINDGPVTVLLEKRK